VSSLVRIVQGRSATLSHTFLTGSTATDPTPDTATVTVTRADGTTFVPTASVDNSATGVASITFTPAETALLDRWTLTWTATFGGQAQTYKDTVEVAGDVLFTIAQARAAITSNAGVLYGYTWPIGYANVLVGYEHGLPSPPPGATRAALDEAVAYLGGGTSVDPRTTRVVTADGTQEYQVGSGALLSAMADRWVSHNRIPVLA
jgi:hypothetical protein